jgi:Fe2+ transport system protein FeoA
MEQILSQIENGKSVSVTEILTSSLTVKLKEMGIVKGKTLTVLYRAPLGDPIAVDIDGYVLSLRKNEANMIKVEPLDVLA